MQTIHPADAQQINAMLGVQEPPKEMEQEYLARLRMLVLAGWPTDRPLGPITLVDMLRSLGFDPPEELSPDVPWDRYPVDGSIRVEARWKIGNGYHWLRGVFRGVANAGIITVQLESEPIARDFLTSEVRHAANQCRRDCDTVSRYLTEPIDASGAPRDMEVPDIGPDDPTEIAVSPPAAEEFDWEIVAQGTPVCVSDDTVTRDGTFVAAKDQCVAVTLDGENFYRWYKQHCCSLK